MEPRRTNPLAATESEVFMTPPTWAEMVPDAPFPMTSEDLENWPDNEYKYELVDGRLVRMPHAGGGHSYLAMELGAELRAFVKPRGLGYVLGADAGFKFFVPNHPKQQHLAPDVSFVRAERAPQPHSKEWDRPWPLVPDLAVEIASPGQTLDDKCDLWLAGGVSLLWVFLPEQRRVEAWQLNAPMQLLGMADVLDGLDVLPGFVWPSGISNASSASLVFSVTTAAFQYLRL
jgi:Uma2 family endonuclease